ncbi:MAG TPA: hypothetical protein VKJ00_05000 [Thermoanaerobaculia bacterium]|nr:hypothetical protein [Thermoanaerobaculia bacterium]
MKPAKKGEPTRPNQTAPTVDEKMTRQEKEELEEQIEQFEGPDRREIRGNDREPKKDPGVSHS